MRTLLKLNEISIIPQCLTSIIFLKTYCGNFRTLSTVCAVFDNLNFANGYYGGQQIMEKGISASRRGSRISMRTVTAICLFV